MGEADERAEFVGDESGWDGEEEGNGDDAGEAGGEGGDEAAAGEEEEEEGIEEQGEKGCGGKNGVHDGKCV